MSSVRRYQPFYCEENIWWLLRDGPLGPIAWAVFITNPARQVAMWSQRSAPPDEPLVWDYHVVAASHSPDGFRIWDLDSRRGAPLEALEWWASSFPFVTPPEFAPCFRVVSRDTMARRFASDRRHMRNSEGAYKALPPAWPCIQTEGEASPEPHSLPAFLDFEGHSELGPVHDRAGFRAWLTGDVVFEEQPV